MEWSNKLKVSVYHTSVATLLMCFGVGVISLGRHSALTFLDFLVCSLVMRCFVPLKYTVKNEHTAIFNTLD